MEDAVQAKSDFSTINTLTSMLDRLGTINSRVISARDKLEAFNDAINGPIEAPDSPTDPTKASEAGLGSIVGKIDDIEFQLNGLELQLTRL